MNLKWMKYDKLINETTQETVSEISKSQNIRIIDVIFIGPIMIYAATFKTLPIWLRLSLLTTGAATIIYNAKNFLKNKKTLKKIDEKKLKAAWFTENAPLGKKLGYPDCCVKEFCDQPPELINGKPTKYDRIRLSAASIDAKYTGFIPCIKHAKQIINGKITLKSLIKNRDKNLPEFPNWGV